MKELEIEELAQRLFNEDGHAGDLYESDYTIDYEARAMDQLTREFQDRLNQETR